jgi:hypothetical protein
MTDKNMYSQFYKQMNKKQTVPRLFVDTTR